MMKPKIILLIVLFFAALGNIRLAWPVDAETIPAAGANYRVYLPMAQKVGPEPYFGLAMAYDEPTDLSSLKAGWYYNWSPNGDAPGAEFVPMSYSGETIGLPADYSGYLLVFNEPNLGAPNGCGLSPQAAAGQYAALRESYPRAKFVVGGWSVFASSWASSFVHELKERNIPLPERWHAHAYTEAWITPSKAQKFLSDFQKLTGGKYWITEYGSPAGVLRDFQSMTDWFLAQSWIERIAPYTNRQPAGAAWAIGSGVDLVDLDDQLTDIGKFYASFTRAGY